MKHARSTILMLSLLASNAMAQVDPASGIDFVMISSPGNAPWMGDGTLGDQSIGRGGVDYSYRIGRYEVTTAQWAEFMNVALDRPANDRIPFVYAPSVWGAVGTTPRNPGAQRFTVPAGNAMLPAGGIDWRTCAILCNWLSNDKRTDRTAFLNGAYDVSTFGYVGNIFTDQATRNPGARYFLPRLDEWMKAAYYSPARGGSGVGGWWTYPNQSNARLTPGAPGVGQANYGFQEPNPYTIPLGAYPQSVSPWGLMDCAGATTEWTESIIDIPGESRGRYFKGSFRGSALGFGASDAIYTWESEYPSIGISYSGFRIAASVPSVPTCTCLYGVVAWLHVRRRRASAPRSDPHGSHQSRNVCSARPFHAGSRGVCGSG